MREKTIQKTEVEKNHWVPWSNEYKTKLKHTSIICNPMMVSRLFFFKIVNIERLVELFDAKSVEAIKKKIVIPSSWKTRLTDIN